MPIIDFDHVKFGVMGKADWREVRRKKKFGREVLPRVIIYFYFFGPFILVF